MTRNHRSVFTVFSILLAAAGLFLWIGPDRVLNRETGHPAQTPNAGQTLPAGLALEDARPSPQLHQAPLEASSSALPGFTLPAATPGPSDTLAPSSSLTPAEGEPQIIGYSVEGRPLDVYRFGSGDRNFMIIAGIHGGYEWNTVTLSQHLIETLKADPTLVPDGRTLYILRVLNADGYAKDKGPDGRANANNVDLNRNWDANWQANWSGAHCWNYRFLTAGSKPFSEPETQALAKFLTENRIEALISYHSAALGIFAGGWPSDKQSLKLAYALSQVSPYAYPPLDEGCLFTGQLIDWASKNGIAAVDVELANHVDDDLQINLRILKAFLSFED